MSSESVFGGLSNSPDGLRRLIRATRRLPCAAAALSG
jgi:hypothetical protein